MSRGGIPTTTAERKIVAAINYLLNNVVNGSDDDDGGGSIAKNWKQSLDKLIEHNRFKLGQF